MQQARQKTQELAGSMGGFSGLMNRHKQTMMEASRATEDFAIVLAGGGGLGMALRSTANNIGVVLNSIHPLAGLFGTLGIAVGTMAVPALLKFMSASDDVGEKLKQL
ncbi:MAG: hypothetical protein KF861_07055, partial [Planctomycetaceae bacterium]|nr:hypothetical protein [Planctomycetaceae bacterium]